MSKFAININADAHTLYSWLLLLIMWRRSFSPVKWRTCHFQPPKKWTKQPRRSLISFFPLPYRSKLSIRSANSIFIFFWKQPPARPLCIIIIIICPTAHNINHYHHHLTWVDHRAMKTTGCMMSLVARLLWHCGFEVSDDWTSGWGATCYDAR